ncbi:ParB/RepB/Spo0J family partition protein [Methanosarcina hadiensis]|uniref:ParB/RepB/Spo0J family partition protein n=1 Tax=Methanosarcina hadiensis TaxID=3078083 RepID=UPI003977AFE6
MNVENQSLQLNTKNLKPHHTNLELYGEENADYKLIESIREDGQLEPLIVIIDKEVSGDYIIISGHRRWKALKYLGKEANCRLVCFEYDENELEIKQAIIESNKYRKKNNTQISNEVALLRSIYAEKEKKLQEVALKQNADMKNAVQQGENNKEVDRTRDQVADGLESVTVLFYQVFSQLSRNQSH